MLSRYLLVTNLCLLSSLTACVGLEQDKAPVVVIEPPPAPITETVVEPIVVAPVVAQLSSKPAAPPKAAEAPAAAIKKVTTIDGIEGEIEGVITPKSKFAKLQIGMTQKQVEELIGRATNVHGYVGKAFIPLSTKNDTHSLEASYKGEGRLIFSPASKFSSSLLLVRITVNPKETGY